MKQLPSAILNMYWSQRSWTTYKRNDGSIKTATWAPTKLINDVEKYADYGPNYANPAGTRLEPGIAACEFRFVDNDESLLGNNIIAVLPSDREAFRWQRATSAI